MERLQDSSSAGAGSVKSSLTGSVASKAKSHSNVSSDLNLQRSLDMVHKLHSGTIAQQFNFPQISASMTDPQQQQQIMSVLSEASRRQTALIDVIAELQAELSEQHQYACQCAVVTRKLQAKLACQHAGTERIRKQNARLSKLIAKDEDFQKAIPVDNFAVPLPESQAKLVLSTRSIAEDNMAQAARMARASGTEGYGKPSEASTCAAGQEISRSDAGGEEQESVQPRDGSKCHQYSNVACSHVWIKTDGPVRTRHQIGGTSIAESVILSRLMTFFQNYISIRTLSEGMPQELENAALEVRAEFDHHSRRSIDKISKTINLTGHACRKTLTESLHASFLALDLCARKESWLKNSAVLTVNVDGSGFEENDMLGIVLNVTFIEKNGTDALGTQRLRATSRSWCQSCLPIADKISVNIRRSDGSLFGKEVPERIVASMLMSGNLYDILHHECCTFGFDKGPETRGGGKGVLGAMRRNAFFGIGSPLQQIFGTRDPIDSVMKGEHGSFLQNCMDFLEVPASQQFLAGFNKRPMPEQLDVDPTIPVPSLAFEITILHRKWDSVKKEHVPLRKIIEQCGSRPSTKLNPMSRYPCIKGGSPAGKWCDKHALNRAGASYTSDPKMKRSMQVSQKISSQLRKIGTHKALKNNIARILGIKGARNPQPSHIAIRNALGEKRLDEYRQKHPRGMPRQEKGVGSRWNSIQDAVMRQELSRMMVAATLPIALANGTEEAKTRAGERVCSEHGFGKDDMTISFPPKLGQLFFYYNSPSYIWHLTVSALIHKFSFKVLMAACADRGEHAALVMGGVNSIVSTVDWVLRRELFVLPAQRLRKCWRSWSGASAEEGKWLLTHRLAHRGLPSIESKGRALLSTRLERIPEGSKSKEPPALLHLYGRFYNPGMAGAVSHAREAMIAVCRMGGDETVIPREYLSDYGRPQGSYAERIAAAQWFLWKESNRAADCILRKMFTTDPLGFLAGLSDVVIVYARRDRDEFSFEVDSDNDFEEIDIATDKAISCANILLLQLKELLSLHGPTLCEFVQEPLRSMLKEEQMEALARFAQRTEVNLAGMTVVPGSERMTGYPKPVTDFGIVSECSMKAATLITNSNPIESKWSFCTLRHSANVRNVSAEYQSAVVRKNDFRDTGLLSSLSSQDFQENLARAREFRRKNREGYRSIFRTNLEESQDKKNCRKKQPEIFERSNIAEAKGNPRKRRSGEIADSDESSEDSNGEDSDEDDDPGPEAGDFDGNAPELDAEGSSPSSVHGSNESEVAGYGVRSAHLSHDEDLDSRARRASYESEFRATLKDMCLSREIQVQPSKGTYCSKEDFIVALLADDASCRTLPQQSPSVAGNSDSVRACSLHSGNIEAPEPSEPSQVVNSEAPIIQPRQDCEDSAGEDRSDVGSEFGSENGWGADEALGRSKAMSGSLASAAGFGIHIAHPFPIVEDVTDQQARDRPWKLDSIHHVLKENEWKDTTVEFQCKGNKLVQKSVILTRLDGRRFPLIKSAHLLYVVFTDDGLELAHLEDVYCKLSHGQRKNTDKKVWVKYSRVLRTKKAIEECDSDQDHHSTVRNGIRRVSSLGANSLRKLLAQQKSQHDTRLIFHRGDFPFETSAENIVGFVACQSACDWVDGASTNNEPKAFLARINASLRLDSCPNELKLSSLSEIDTVYLGQDFSEPADDEH